MGIASFLFGREISRTQIGDFIVDCTISLVTDFSANVTKNAIQDGSVVSDHVSINPMTFKIDGLITEDPIGSLASELSSVAGGLAGGLLGSVGAKAKIGGAALVGTGLGAVIGSSLGGTLSKFVGGRSDPANYPKIAMKTLIKAFESREPFRIRTYFHQEEKKNLYDQMVITSLSFPQSSSEGNSLKFSMTAEQIRIVSLQIGTVSGDFIKGVQAANSAESKSDLGTQGEEKTKEPTKKKASDLYKQFNPEYRD